jgi:hypothetical protein
MAEPEDAAIAALRTALQDADPNAKASLIGRWLMMWTLSQAWWITWAKEYAMSFVLYHRNGVCPRAYQIRSKEYLSPPVWRGRLLQQEQEAEGSAKEAKEQEAEEAKVLSTYRGPYRKEPKKRVFHLVGGGTNQ